MKRKNKGQPKQLIYYCFRNKVIDSTVKLIIIFSWNSIHLHATSYINKERQDFYYRWQQQWHSLFDWTIELLMLWTVDEWPYNEEYDKQKLNTMSVL